MLIDPQEAQFRLDVAAGQLNCYVVFADYLADNGHPQAEELQALGYIIASEEDAMAVVEAAELYEMYLKLS